MVQYVIYNQAQTEQTIIAIPALGERKEMFEQLAGSLQDFRLIAIDLPGHNQSTDLEDLSIETYVGNIKKLVDQLGITQAHFIGNSIGAWIIQSYYTTNPVSVLSLTLLDGGYFHLGDDPEMDMGEIELPVIDKLEDSQSAITNQVSGMDKLSHNTKQLVEKYFLENFIERDEVYVHHSNVVALNTLSKAAVETNYCLPETKKLPILLVVADEDKEHSVDDKLARFLRTHNNVTVEHVPNSYHFLPLTNAQDVANHFKAFITLLNK